MVGAVAVGEVDAAGSPPGTDGLAAEWTASEAAYRYLVALRASDNNCELDVRGCAGGWYVTTADTVLTTTVPARDLKHGSGTRYLDVYAVVGAWRRRSYGFGS